MASKPAFNPANNQLSPRDKRVALIAVSLGTAQSAMTLSSIQIAIPELARELQADAVLIGWIPMSFLLINAIFILPMGRYADAVGRRKVYLLGMALFALGNLLAAFSQTMEWMLLCRAFQGFATAMMHATGMAIISSIYTGKERAGALGITASAIYLGLALGPVVGGFLTEYAGWRSVFAAQVPLSLLNIFLVGRFIRGEWKSNEPMPVDWPGTGLLAVVLSCIVIATSLPIDSAFPSAQLVLLLGGVVFAWLFARHIARVPYPLVRWHAIRGNIVFLSSLTTAFFVYAGNYTLVFLLSLLLQYTMGMTPSGAGLIVLLQVLMVVFVSLLFTKRSFAVSQRALASIGCALVSLAFFLLSLLTSTTPFALVVLALLLNGIGIGMFTTPNNNLAMGAVNPDRLSSASAILNLSRYLGNMAGTAVVMLLITVFLGRSEIGPQNYEGLQQVGRYAFIFASLSTAIASLLAYRARPTVNR